MNELLRERLFSLLAESSQVTNEEMQNAYECFMEQLKTTVRQSENNSDVFRMLKVTRIELVSVRTLHRYEQGKKCA